MSEALSGPYGLALVAPLVQEFTNARDQLERLARENGELRAQLRILEQGMIGKPEPDRASSADHQPPARPWWRRIFG